MVQLDAYVEALSRAPRLRGPAPDSARVIWAKTRKQEIAAETDLEDDGAATPTQASASAPFPLDLAFRPKHTGDVSDEERQQIIIAFGPADSAVDRSRFVLALRFKQSAEDFEAESSGQSTPPTPGAPTPSSGDSSIIYTPASEEGITMGEYDPEKLFMDEQLARKHGMETLVKDEHVRPEDADKVLAERYACYYRAMVQTENLSRLCQDVMTAHRDGTKLSDEARELLEHSEREGISPARLVQIIEAGQQYFDRHNGRSRDALMFHDYTDMGVTEIEVTDDVTSGHNLMYWGGEMTEDDQEGKDLSDLADLVGYCICSDKDAGASLFPSEGSTPRSRLSTLAPGTPRVRPLSSGSAGSRGPSTPKRSKHDTASASGLSYVESADDGGATPKADEDP